MAFERDTSDFTMFTKPVSDFVFVRMDEVGTQHFGKMSVNDRRDGVEFCDESMFDPIDDPFTAKYHETHEACFLEPVTSKRETDVSKILNHNHKQEDRQLKSLDDVARRNLHQVVMIEALEDSTLQFDEVIRHQHDE